MTIHWWLALERFRKSTCGSCRNMKSKSLGSVLLRRSSCESSDLLTFCCQKRRGFSRPLCSFMMGGGVCQRIGWGEHGVESLGLAGCLGGSMHLGVGFVSHLGDPWGKVMVCMVPLAAFVCAQLSPISLLHSLPVDSLVGGCPADL